MLDVFARTVDPNLIHVRYLGHGKLRTRDGDWHCASRTALGEYGIGMNPGWVPVNSSRTGQQVADSGREAWSRTPRSFSPAADPRPREGDGDDVGERAGEAASFDDFERAQADALRRRMTWTLAFALALWGFAFVFADDLLYGSRSGKLETRLFQLVWAGGMILWLRRERTRTAMEALLLAGGGTMMVLSAISLGHLEPDQLVFAVISRLLGVFFIVHLLQLRWPSALIAYGIAAATMLTGYAANQVDGVHRIGLASMWVLAPIPILTYATHLRERRQREAFLLRRDLVEANGRLAAEVSNRTRLFLGLSHDLRTPLSVVRGEAERLGALDDRAAREAAVGRITEHVDYATDLIDQLLELARLDEGTAHSQAVPHRLERSLRELAAQLCPPRGATIVVSGPPATVVAEPRHVRRILMNLIANALRHVDPAEGRVEVIVRTDESSDVVEVEVRDDGPGIDDATAPKLFRRFATMAANGTVVSGVGLPLARELAELNGGSLELRSARPAAFVLTLRRALDAPADARAPAQGAPTGARVPVQTSAGPPHAAARRDRCAVGSGAPRVLVVEDNAALAALLEEQLEPELRVSVAATLSAAHEALTREPFDVVLADMGLPDGDGLELLAGLREAGRAAPAFIVLSAVGDAETRARTIAAGADDYIVKPYARAELRARIERALRQARERELALERQRDEVLAELHDGVGGALARALTTLRGAPEGGAAEGPTARAITRRAVAELRLASEELRDGLRLLSERDCAWGAVVADLRFTLASIAEAHGIAFEADCGRAGAILRPVVAHALRRIAIEAMTNVVKHAEAKRVRFAIACDGETIRMEMSDDGRGLPSDRTGGFGLGVMRARAARLGGALEVRAGDGGRGVLVSLRVPCAACGG